MQDVHTAGSVRAPRVRGDPLRFAGNGPLTQLVECDRHKVEVAGSTPARPTIFFARVRGRNRGLDAVGFLGIGECAIQCAMAAVTPGHALAQRGTTWHNRVRPSILREPLIRTTKPCTAYRA